MNDVATLMAPATSELPSFSDYLTLIKTFRDAKSSFKAIATEPNKIQWNNIDIAFTDYVTDEKRWGGEVEWIERAAVKKKPAYKEKTLVKLKPINKHILLGLKLFHEIMIPPFRSAFAIWALNNKDYFAQIAARPESFDYDTFRGDVAEAFGQALKASGKCSMFEDPKNNQFVTRLSNGTWKILSDEEMTALIQRKNPNSPNVFVTANHAFLEEIGDIQSTVDEYGDLITTVNEINKGGLEAGNVVRGDLTIPATDNEGKPKLDANDQPILVKGADALKKFVTGKKENHIVCYDKQTDKPNQTIIVAALNTRENNFLNLGTLFHRLHEVEQANKNGVGTDEFKYTSPIARMMVSTVLRAIVQDPSRITKGDNGTPPSFVQGDGSVELLPNAAEIVRNVQFHGFSKGGNDFRDGMRLLARTLNAKQNDKKNDLPLFQLPENTPNPSRDILKDIVSNLSVGVQSLNEKEMDPWYQSRGVSMTYFTNRHDTIAVPPKHAPTLDGDVAITDDGQKEAKAHHPSAITFNLRHPYILQHYQCALASYVGKPALRFVMFDKAGDPTNPHYSLTLRTAPGTTDEMMKVVQETLDEACNIKRDHHIRYRPPTSPNPLVYKDKEGKFHSYIKVQKREGTSGGDRWELISTKQKNPEKPNETWGADHLLDPRTLDALHDVFLTLSRTPEDPITRKPKERTEGDMPVIVSSALSDPGLAILKTDCSKVKLRRNSKDTTDWKSEIKSTVAEWFDHRMAQINIFMGGQEPVDKAPPMAQAAAGRGL